MVSPKGAKFSLKVAGENFMGGDRLKLHMPVRNLSENHVIKNIKTKSCQIFFVHKIGIGSFLNSAVISRKLACVF